MGWLEFRPGGSVCHCSPQVSPDERVGALKRLVAENLHVPVAQQRLLFKGKALAGASGGSSGGLWKISGALRGQGPLPEHRCGGRLLWSLLITLWSQLIHLPATQGG